MTWIEWVGVGLMVIGGLILLIDLLNWLRRI